jgi:CheY-like chemotaxis protein
LAFLGMPHLLQGGLAHVDVSRALTMGQLNLLGIHWHFFLGLRLRPLGQATAPMSKRMTSGGAGLWNTDIRMPDMDGIEAARILNQEEPLPVILVTAYHDEETIKRAETAGIMAFLVKPIKVDVEQLAYASYRQVYAALKRVRTKRERRRGQPMMVVPFFLQTEGKRSP